jgi:hypothetical protein
MAVSTKRAGLLTGTFVSVSLKPGVGLPKEVRPQKSETRKYKKAKCYLLKYINF